MTLTESEKDELRKFTIAGPEVSAVNRRFWEIMAKADLDEVEQVGREAEANGAVAG